MLKMKNFEGAKMSILAKFTLQDGSIEQEIFNSWPEFTSYVENH